jgi:hypothetical protein
MKIAQKKSPRLIILASIIILIVVAIGSIATYQSRFNVVPHLAAEGTQTAHTESFPDIDQSKLDPTQQKIVALLRQEYVAQNKGTKYSGGVDEPWCADFVSWIMNQADVPLHNPNSGSWRIPGTYTLREYYQSTGKFKSGSSTYQPKVGDVVLYDNPSPFGQHTNIVVRNVDGVITTVGGNEPGGIRVYTHTDADKAGLVGYGVL